MPGLRVSTRVDVRHELSIFACFRLKALLAAWPELMQLTADAMSDNPCLEPVDEEEPPIPCFDGEGQGALLDRLPAPPASLIEDLLEQLRLARLAPREERIGQCIIERLDDDGFLEATLDEVARAAGVWPDMCLVEAVLARVQRFDPPGIAARDRIESFVLQLRSRGYADDSVPVRLVREQLAVLTRRPLARVAAALGVSPEQCRSAARLVARLEPSPGRREADRPCAIVPDVVLQEQDGAFAPVVMHRRLRVRGVGPSTPETRAWRRSARWLIQALDQRRETLQAVAEVIVRAQREFLEGRGPLRPLVLRDVAGELGRHESTVSRAVADKYIATPRGTLPLKGFFVRPSGVNAAASADRVKLGIADLLARENRTRPLSDEQIARALSEHGLRVSRRTIAKYREQLGHPSAAVRRCRTPSDGLDPAANPAWPSSPAGARPIAPCAPREEVGASGA
jgi:RNA polymerase sigma-54 factor